MVKLLLKLAPYLNTKKANINILRIILIILFFVFITLLILNLSYKSLVVIQLPISDEKNIKKISPVGEFKVISSSEILNLALRLIETNEVKIKRKINEIKNNLFFKYEPDSYCFELYYYDKSKQLAIKIINAIADAYVSNFTSKLNETISNNLQTLYMRQLELEKLLLNANARYEKFCIDENIGNLDTDYTFYSIQHSQYVSELAKISAEISIVENLTNKNINYRSISDVITFDNDNLVNNKSEEDSELNRKIRESEIRLQMLRKKYTNLHPLVKNEMAFLEILKSRVNLVENNLNNNVKVIKSKFFKNEQLLSILYAKRNAYIELIKRCDEALKLYPKKKAILKSYEVEISRLENLLSMINQQINESKLTQNLNVNNVPKIIEKSINARLSINYFYFGIAIISLLLFISSFKLQSKIEHLKEIQQINDYKKLVTEHFKLNILGTIHKINLPQFNDPLFSSACVTYYQKESKFTRQMNTIQNNIISQLDKNTGMIFAITSLNIGEGKSFISANLSILSALLGNKTLSIDFNYKSTNPSLSNYFKINSNFGVTDIVVGETSYEDVLNDTAVEDLKFIATGLIPPNTQKVFSSQNCLTFIKQVLDKFNLVIIDCPSFNFLSDFKGITTFIKNIVLVIDVNKINSQEEFKEELESFINYAHNANLYVLGVIFNEK